MKHIPKILLCLLMAGCTKEMIQSDNNVLVTLPPVTKPPVVILNPLPKITVFPNTKMIMTTTVIDVNRTAFKFSEGTKSLLLKSSTHSINATTLQCSLRSADSTTEYINFKYNTRYHVYTEFNVVGVIPFEMVTSVKKITIDASKSCMKRYYDGCMAGTACRGIVMASPGSLFAMAIGWTLACMFGK